MSGAPIRVLHCIHSLSGGGAERQLNLLAKYSSGASVEHAVFCVSRAGLDAGEVAMPVYQATSSSKWNWRLWSDLRRALREFRPQIVQAWLPASMTIPALMLARASGIRTVFSYRTQMLFHRPIAVPEWLVALLCSDRVVSNTPVEACARPFRYLYRVKRGFYIPNSVAFDEMARKNTSELPAGEPLKVLFVGRLVRDKNPECLLAALAKVKEFPWRLTVCGRGENEGRLRELARRLDLESNIEWLGFRKDIGQIMAAHDILVLPSWREGSPNVALEAMAVGLPCILSSIPGNIALFAGPQSALLIDPAKPQELAAALRKLREDDALRARLSARGIAWVREFRPEETARSYTLFYHHLLETAA